MHYLLITILNKETLTPLPLSSTPCPPLTAYLSPQPQSSPCGNCMIPTLIPEIRSPRAFSLREYRGSHDKTGTLLSRHLFSLGPEHLSVTRQQQTQGKKRLMRSGITSCKTNALNSIVTFGDMTCCLWSCARALTMTVYLWFFTCIRGILSHTWQKTVFYDYFKSKNVDKSGKLTTFLMYLHLFACSLAKALVTCMDNKVDKTHLVL